MNEGRFLALLAVVGIGTLIMYQMPSELRQNESSQKQNGTKFLEQEVNKDKVTKPGIPTKIVYGDIEADLYITSKPTEFIANDGNVNTTIQHYTLDDDAFFRINRITFDGDYKIVNEYIFWHPISSLGPKVTFGVKSEGDIRASKVTRTLPFYLIKDGEPKLFYAYMGMTRKESDQCMSISETRTKQGELQYDAMERIQVCGLTNGVEPIFKIAMTKLKDGKRDAKMYETNIVGLQKGVVYDFENLK